jgi:hypothetical protein
MWGLPARRPATALSSPRLPAIDANVRLSICAQRGDLESQRQKSASHDA